jgi:hypothetical protein
MHVAAICWEPSWRQRRWTTGPACPPVWVPASQAFPRRACSRSRPPGQAEAPRKRRTSRSACFDVLQFAESCWRRLLQARLRTPRRLSRRSLSRGVDHVAIADPRQGDERLCIDDLIQGTNRPVCVAELDDVRVFAVEAAPRIGESLGGEHGSATEPGEGIMVPVRPDACLPGSLPD